MKKLLFLASLIITLLFMAVISLGASSEIPKGATFSLVMGCSSRSMGNLLDCKDRAYGTWIFPTTTIKLGDIVALRKTVYGKFIVHRVIEKKIDDRGEFFITKGDNNTSSDEEWLGKVRRKDLKGKIISIQKR